MALSCRTDKVTENNDFARQTSTIGNIKCYIILPNDTVMNIEVDNKADGQEVLDKVCKSLAIIDESDYFGIQYAISKKELIWLNMRNRLSRQISGSTHYHLYFRVKYFVQPHTLIMEETRKQFYLNVVHYLKLGLWDADTTLNLKAHLIALMAHREFGPFNPLTTPCKYACFWSNTREEIPFEAIRLAASFHKEFGDMTSSKTESEVLRLTHSDVPAYGVFYYDIRNVYSKKMLLGVGPEYLAICSAKDMTFIERYPYCRLESVTVTNKVVYLNLFEEDGSIKKQNYQLSSVRVANSLYRSITELHCFFRCDTVRENVLNQTNNDLKDALTSLFDHSAKDYTFDVRSTCREVYERARRHVYKLGLRDNILGISPPNTDQPLDSNLPPTANCSHSSVTAASILGSHTSNEDVQEIVSERLREVSLCRICMDSPIDRVFFPCGHAVCCTNCAECMNSCPVCRSEIQMRHLCYLPFNDQGYDNVLPPSSKQRLKPKHRAHTDSLLSTDSITFHQEMTLNISEVPQTSCSIGDAHSLTSLVEVPLKNFPIQEKSFPLNSLDKKTNKFSSNENMAKVRWKSVSESPNQDPLLQSLSMPPTSVIANQQEVSKTDK